MSSERKVRLQSTDGEIFAANKSVLHEMQNLTQAIERVEIENTIRFPKVSGRTLAKILDYCKYHWELTQQISTSRQVVPEDAVKQWDAEFMKVEDAMLVDIMVAAKYLGIKSLYALACRTVNRTGADKNPEDYARFLLRLVEALLPNMNTVD